METQSIRGKPGENSLQKQDKYGLTGDEMKKYGNNLPLVMKIKMSLDELKKVDIELMTNILAEYII